MKPYTKFQLRRIRRIAIVTAFIWMTSAAIAYGLGAMKGIDDRKNLAAANEAELRQRIANKQWSELLAQGEFMSGIPAKQNTERN